MDKIEWIEISKERPIVPKGKSRVHVLAGCHRDDGEWFCWSCWYDPKERTGTNGLYDEIEYDSLINKIDLLDLDDDGLWGGSILGDAGEYATHWAYLPKFN